MEPELISQSFWDLRRKHHPWWKQGVWWPLCRFWEDWAPGMVYRRLKWLVQRAWRGWSDRDIWSLDSYLAGWMPAALRRLKATKHGIPIAMFTDVDRSAMEVGGYADSNAAEARWNETLDKMIAGFEAYNRLSEGLWEDELGEYPMKRGPEADARFAASEKLRTRDEGVWAEGAALFITHFGSLWD